ncbi:glycosyltransferase family 2 protein [Nocardioides sp.]|uniref:glycosyltransferase family 2 protein n=1 Tax=Nocardioides sp. TaxID=35761 RepID=UPI002BAF39BF|nr:glycosyltransferase family 2 protein [Nocardioides sp.]HSX66298.1 glycosyltransferase family 2 protein [Nocardioides sp.]
MSGVHESVAVVVVTYNRSAMLTGMLDGLAAQTRPADAIFVIDNASTDDTRAVLDARTDLPMTVTTTGANLGGAGGFHLGMLQAYDAGHDRILLMDDDVVPAPDFLEVMVAHRGPCQMAVREDLQGRLVEKSAVRFDLDNPLAIKPKTASVDSTYATRAEMPAEVEVENVAFEGFMVRRDVIAAIGLPDPSFFIFYDDVDFAVRARKAGFPIVCVRDAVLVRQLDFNQQHALDTWKGFYMYRNLFVVHFRYGGNVLVRLKPWLIVLMVVLLSPLRGGRGEAANVIKAIRSAGEMRHLDPASSPSALPPPR